jgi:hypothetical protein
MKVFEILDKFKTVDKFKARSLTEPKKSLNAEAVQSAQHAADLIESHCSKFVEAYQETGEFIYRGVKESEKIKGYGQLLITADIRPDRKPVFLNQDFQKIIDAAMDTLELKAKRGNSIFCTTSESTARDWGNSYIIFVKDGWDATIFENVKDDYVYNYLDKIKKVIDKTDDMDEKISITAGALKRLEPKRFNDADNLAQVIDLRYEDILITGSGYIGLKYVRPWAHSEDKDHEFMIEVLELLGIEIK